MVHPLIVIGSQGFIGRHFCRAFPNALAIDRSQLDLVRPVINFSTDGYHYALIAAGVGNPRKCEEDPEMSYQCNVEGTLALGKQLIKRNITPIFCSTDYVLNDNLDLLPFNIYGKQKAELEERAIRLDALVIRLSKVYGIEKGDGTLFDEMAAKLSRGECVNAARDQVFAPVFVGDVTHRVEMLMKQQVRDVVSVTGPSFTSRLEMARYLALQLGVDQAFVQDISLDELKDGVKRPKQLRLSSTWPGISWREGIEKVVQNYGA